MADFDNFESSGAPQEEDPAAEFLAREQNEMAGLEDDFGAAQPAPAAAASDDFFGVDSVDTGSTEPVAISESANDDIMAAFDSPAPQSDPMMADDFFGGDSEAPAESAPEPATEFTGGDPMLDAFDTPSSQEPIALDGDAGAAEPTGYEAIAQVDKIRVEPEKIKKWREDQKIRLEKKDAESETKKNEWREVAKKELEDWYKHREEQLEKTFKLNREAEAAFVQERDDTIPGHEWERICRLCEFNPKAARNQKDISRMRSILLQLKQAPLVR